MYLRNYENYVILQKKKKTKITYAMYSNAFLLKNQNHTITWRLCSRNKVTGFPSEVQQSQLTSLAISSRP